MKKTMAIVLIIIGTVALAAGIILLCTDCTGDIMDGPGMIYSFKINDLSGEWVCVEKENDATLSFSRSTMTYKGVFGDDGKTDYKVENDGAFGKDEKERKIELDGNGPFEYLLYSEEEILGKKVGIVSAIITEYDGRGSIVIEEYVKKDNISLIPDNFRSELCVRYNDREVPSDIV